MKKIYICHQYYDKTHFKALYDKAEQYGYKIEDYIVLGQWHIFAYCYKNFVREHQFFKAIKYLISYEKKIAQLSTLKDSIIIVGLAPYDKLMNRFSKIFKKNNCIYFTSWQFWDGSSFPRGTIKNRKNFEKCISECFYGVASVSKETEKNVKKFNENTKVVNHSIDVESYKKKIRKERSGKYLYLGKFIDIKNIDLILQYFSENSDVSIDFVGWGEKEELIKRYCSEYNNIFYKGRWSKGEIKENLCLYDYLILPSKEEPFGIVLLEALASGVPCIVSNALGPNEIIKNFYNGFVFDKDSKDDFINVMDKSQQIENDLYRNLCVNSLDESRKYSTDSICKKWIELIESKWTKK